MKIFLIILFLIFLFIGISKVQAKEIFFTSYNAQESQTDNSPCIGASGRNQCHLAKKGHRIIALSQDLVGRAKWKPFHFGDRVLLQSENPQCNGEYIILDTMNERYTNRGDIFMMNSKDNTSCTAQIYKLI